MESTIQRVKIKEAVEYYNSKKPTAAPPLTTKDLAEEVIQDRNARAGGQISTAQKEAYFSKFNNGKDACPHHYLKAIAEKTGVTTDYLVGLTDKPGAKR